MYIRKDEIDNYINRADILRKAGYREAEVKEVLWSFYDTDNEYIAYAEKVFVPVDVEEIDGRWVRSEFVLAYIYYFYALDENENIIVDDNDIPLIDTDRIEIDIFPSDVFYEKFKDGHLLPYEEEWPEWRGEWG